MLKTAKSDIYFWLHEYTADECIKGKRVILLMVCQILPETGKKCWFLNLIEYQLLVYACICTYVNGFFLFACVCLSFQAGSRTISGSVPHLLRCLIGQTDQSERGLVVPTIRPCVPWAWAWGGQYETTSCYSTSPQQQFSSNSAHLQRKVAEFNRQPDNTS